MRRDRLGRRIGANWWRDHVTSVYRPARDAWEALRESGYPAYGAAGAANSGAACWQLSEDEFAALFPPPTFKATLVALSGMSRESL